MHLLLNIKSLVYGFFIIIVFLLNKIFKQNTDCNFSRRYFSTWKKSIKFNSLRTGYKSANLIAQNLDGAVNYI
jgi:hypothetical protein